MFYRCGLKTRRKELAKTMWKERTEIGTLGKKGRKKGDRKIEESGLRTKGKRHVQNNNRVKKRAWDLGERQKVEKCVETKNKKY